jgi:hypothetical protein
MHIPLPLMIEIKNPFVFPKNSIPNIWKRGTHRGASSKLT